MKAHVRNALESFLPAQPDHLWLITVTFDTRANRIQVRHKGKGLNPGLAIQMLKKAVAMSESRANNPGSILGPGGLPIVSDDGLST